MQPVVLTICGDYWDSFIYKGRLYLWGYNEELTIYNWDELIDYLIMRYSLEQYREAIDFSFKDGRIYYEKYPEDKRPYLKDQIIYLSQFAFELNRDDLANFQCLSISNPFPELATDIEVFNDVIYGGTDDGLFEALIDQNPFNFKVISNKQKIWGETEVVRLKANYGGRLALSTGPDGLFELRLGDKYFGPNSFQVSNKHSSFADWNYSNIYSSSDDGLSFLALFEKIDTVEKVEKRQLNLDLIKSAWDKKETFLEMGNVLSQKDLFNVNGHTMSWGNGNKIYLWDKNKVLKTDFLQYKAHADSSSNDVIDKIEVINLKSNYAQEIISAGVTYFGILVELEDRLLIIYESGKETMTYDLKLEVTKWRAFPRSVKYENQVHVVSEKSIKILSFNNDYFNDQKNKRLGMRFFKSSK